MSAYQDRRAAAAQCGTSLSPAIALVVLFLAVITSSIALLLLIKTPVFFPSLSVISLAMGGAVAAVAWMRSVGSDRRHFTLWDISGAYAFVGFAAGMISEPAQVVEFMSLSADPLGEAQ